MKIRVAPKTIDELVANFPIEGNVDGWRFRWTETSNLAFVVEGSDLFGRQVSRQGQDLEQLQADVEKDAREVNEELAKETR